MTRAVSWLIAPHKAMAVPLAPHSPLTVDMLALLTPPLMAITARWPKKLSKLRWIASAGILQQRRTTLVILL